jgi:Reverse transcriptase (RNA-dependent DNA polymerase)
VLNSVVGRRIILRRGVRQGDPISPYLFILAMNFLAAWMKKLNETQLLKLVFPSCRSCLQYADDTLILLKPEDQQLQILKMVFHIFGEMSGLRINLQKSKLLVTCSSSQLVEHLASIMQCKTLKFPLLYLGLPLSDKPFTK